MLTLPGLTRTCVFRLKAAVCLLLLVIVPSIAAEPEDMTLVVGGSPVATTRPATWIDGEWFIPLLPVANALGMQVQGTPDMQMLKVQRSDATEYTYNIRTGEIRHGFVRAGVVRNPERIPIEAVNDQLLFPESGAVALLGLSIREDQGRNLLIIDLQQDAGGNAAAPGTPLFNVTRLNHSVGFFTNGRESSQIVGVQGEGLVGATRFAGTFQGARNSRRSFSAAILSLRADLEGRRSLIFGDQGSYSGMDAISASVRGFGYEAPVRGFSLYSYGGRSVSGTSASLGTNTVSAYDTTVGGLNLRKASPGRDISFAANYFSNQDRRGAVFGAAYSSLRKRNQFKVQVLGGSFSGLSLRQFLINPEVGLEARPVQSSRPVEVKGPAAGYSLTDTYSPVSQLTITGQTEFYSSNFLTARNDTRFNGQRSNTASVSVRPTGFLSLNGGASERSYPGEGGKARTYNYGIQGAVPGSSPVLLGLFRLRTVSSLNAGRMSLDQYSVNLPRFRQNSFSFYYSRILVGADAVRTASFSGTRTTRFGRFGLHESLQFQGPQRYGVDWEMPLTRGEDRIRLGVDRLSGPGGNNGWAPSAVLRLPLFRGHSLQLTYTGEPRNHMLQVELTGPIVAGRQVDRNSGGELTVLVDSQLSGRVYQDVNGDGQFDRMVDQAAGGIQIRLDNGSGIATDSEGNYRFPVVASGAHQLHVNMEGVPADLVLADSNERTIAVVPYGRNTQDFRLVRTGRLIGRLTYVDYSQGRDRPVELPLPDARIVLTPSLDTYTETNGTFLAGDLPPGSYVARVDPESIPEGYVSTPASILVEVKAGQTAAGILFRVDSMPRTVIEREAPILEIN